LAVATAVERCGSRAVVLRAKMHEVLLERQRLLKLGWALTHKVAVSDSVLVDRCSTRYSTASCVVVKITHEVVCSSLLLVSS
jgi:hypothetical protein